MKMANFAFNLTHNSFVTNMLDTSLYIYWAHLDFIIAKVFVFMILAFCSFSPIATIDFQQNAGPRQNEPNNFTQ